MWAGQGKVKKIRYFQKKWIFNFIFITLYTPKNDENEKNN